MLMAGCAALSRPTHYLRVLYAAYHIDDPGLPPIQLSLPTKLLNLGLAAIIIGFGFCPDRIVELAKAAVKTVL